MNLTSDQFEFINTAIALIRPRPSELVTITATFDNGTEIKVTKPLWDRISVEIIIDNNANS